MLLVTMLLFEMNKDRALKRMQLGAKAILDLTGGDFEEADMKASIGEFEDNKEYMSIVDYWKKSAVNSKR